MDCKQRQSEGASSCEVVRAAARINIENFDGPQAGEDVSIRVAEPESFGYDIQLPKILIAQSAARKTATKPKEEIAA